MLVSAPSQSDLSSVLGLLELVRLASDADKVRDLIEALIKERKVYDEALAESHAAERRAIAERAAADERIAYAGQAMADRDRILAQAQDIVNMAKAERDAADALMADAQERAANVAAAEQSIVLLREQVNVQLQDAQRKAAEILGEAQTKLDAADQALADAEKIKAAVASKLAQISAIAGETEGA